ncbi:MAG TPA: uroporphyrinogen-III C-methyltransferase [Gemmatimonadaceae bacterium]|nr:uroporphyrinogen-III C-methyltransferase [Gemmatimonadaceae bacterium]
MTGTVYLVGAGPGDPGLLTLRGGELLVTCDAIVHDTHVSQAMLALASVGERETPIEIHDVGRRDEQDSARQEEINALLVRLARDGKRVVRLRVGDPFVFGRGSQEALALAEAGVPFEIVPGVTAGVAAPAYAGIPLTHRGTSRVVTFASGHADVARGETEVDWRSLARVGGTIVVFMGAKMIARIASALVEGGLPASTPAAAVQSATEPSQRTIVGTVGTLADDIARVGLVSPVLIVIGDVVALREQLAWFDTRPLFGKRIVVTRARAQAGEFVAQLAAAGAEVLEMPATRIEPLVAAPLATAISRLREYGWVIFTSQNAVRIFWEALRAASRDARALAGVKVAAVGSATAAALLDCGIAVDLTPERFVAEGLLDALRERRDVRGVRVLYAAAEGARETLQEGLEELGAVVERMTLYRSVPDGTGAAELRERLLRGEVDLVTFTAPSTVNAFVQAVGPEAAARARAASIGPVTSDAARAAGLEVVVEAGESTIPGLVQAICDHMAPGAAPTS